MYTFEESFKCFEKFLGYCYKSKALYFEFSLKKVCKKLKALSACNGQFHSVVSFSISFVYPKIDNFDDRVPVRLTYGHHEAHVQVLAYFRPEPQVVVELEPEFFVLAGCAEK